MTKYSWDSKVLSGGGWRNPIILHSPVPLGAITFRAKVKSATNIGIGDIGEFIQTAGDQSDAYYVTAAADTSKVASVLVMDTEHNREVLARDNSVDTYSGLTRGTAQFAADSDIDVCWLVPGMIFNAKLANSQTPAIGQHAICAGSGKIKDMPDISAYTELPATFRYLEISTSVASLVYITVMVGV